jgi:phosphorylcholine metabolism protein LicD
MNGGLGNPQKTMLLNNTLVHIISLLKKYQVTDWFIGYGTLLGIVRNNSCIKGDDDIDIIINRNYAPVLTTIAKEHNMKCIKTSIFMRFEHPEYAPVDFYLAKVENDGFVDKLEKTKWTNVYPLVKKKWRGVTLQLPKQYLTNLKNRYGPSWRTPKKSKGRRATVKTKTPILI